MDITLPADLESRVNETVKSGEFASREEFFMEAAELLLGLRQQDLGPIAVGENWESCVDAFIEEAQASGEAKEMTERDWERLERAGLALLQARKKA